MAEAGGESFRFGFKLSYDEAVESLLYDVDTFGLQLPPHAIQRKSEKTLFCLLCCSQLQNSPQKDELRQHLQSHTVHEDANALDTYHEGFAGLERDFQMQQVFFQPRSNRYLQCLICQKSIPLRCVKDHCWAHEHARRAQQCASEYFQEAQLSINQAKLITDLSGLTLGESSKTTTSKAEKPKKERKQVNAPTTSNSIIDKPEKVNKIKSRTFINKTRSKNKEQEKNQINDEIITTQNIGNQDEDIDSDNSALFHHQCNKLLYCLLCCEPVQHFEKHCVSLPHDKKLKSLLTGNGPDYQRVTAYFNLWDYKLPNIPGTIRKYFVARNNHSVKCLLCNEFVNLSMVPQHIQQFPCAFLTEENPMYSTEFNWHKLRGDYLKSKSALTKKYPDEILQQVYPCEDFFDGNLGVYTIQKRSDEEIYCLICNAAVRDVGKHLLTLAHVGNANKKMVINTLLKYHRFFTNEEVEVQKLQVTVNLHKKNLYQCAACGKCFGFPHFVAHTQECYFIDGNSAGYRDDLVGENANLVVRRTADGVENNAEGGVNNKQNDVKNDVRVREKEMVEADLCYDDETLMTLYPTCNTPRGQRRPGILTIQKRSDFEKYCLPCGTSVYTRGVEHISGEKHQKMVATKRKQLEQYHRFWMAQTPAMQLLQIYFNPASIDLMKCLGCHNRLHFAGLQRHLPCVKYIKKTQAAYALPERLTQFEVNYEKEIVRRFFYGLHYDLSRDILGTHVPIAYVCKRYFYCLLCPDPNIGTMVRTVEPWKRHLQRYHCKSGVKRERKMEDVLKFHEYWAAQTLERQFYLSHFTLQADGVLCDQGHTLQLHEAVDHIETAGNCELHRIVVEEHNQREDMQRPRDDTDADGDGNQATDKPNKSRDKTPKEHRIELIYPETQEQDNGQWPAVVLPIYLQEHGKFLAFVNPEIPNEVTCTACNVSMRNSRETLRHHLSTPGHGQKAKVPGRVQFYCGVCMEKCHSKAAVWLKHLESDKHIHIVKNLPAGRRDDMNEFYCHGCRDVIFGDKICLIRHESDGGERGNKKKPNTLTEKMKDLLATRAKIEETALELAANCAKFREDSRPKVDECIGDLEELIKQSYPNCRIYQFGSRVAGFVVEDSDLDLFVDVDNKYLGTSLDYHEERKVVLEVRRLLKTQPKTYVDLHTVLSARVPIAKVVHAPTELDCDLSFISGLSVENTRLIRFFADVQPLFAQAMLVLKEWGSRMSCKLKNDMTSYALCMMAIFSMQQDGQLPSVHQLRALSTFDVTNISGWDTVDYSRLDVAQLKASLQQPASVADVVRSFFQYYGHFNYARMVACPMLGHTFDVRLFDNKGKDTPVEMHTYRNKVEVDPDAQFRVSCHMFVQDPFDLGHNLTKLANQKFVKDFKKLCQLSYAHIQ